MNSADLEAKHAGCVRSQACAPRRALPALPRREQGCLPISRSNERERNRIESARVKTYNEVVGSFDSRLLPAARRFSELGAGSGDEIEPIDEIDTTTRTLFAR